MIFKIYMSLKDCFVSIVSLPLLNMVKFSEVDGIKLATFRNDEKIFHLAMNNCLALIKNTSSSRYDRVLSNLHWIVSSSIPAEFGGLYANGSRACFLNFNLDWYKKDPVYMEAYYAKVIVHEATHAFLYKRGVRTTKSNYLRVERICHKEENSFIHNMDEQRLGLKDQLYQEFDPSIFMSYWQKKFVTRLFEFFKRWR